MARLTKNCSYGHRDLLSSFPKRPYFLSSGEWTLRNNFSRASWFIRVLSAHSRTRVWGRDLPVTPVILRNKGFPCITSMIIPSPSSHGAFELPQRKSTMPCSSMCAHEWNISTGPSRPMPRSQVCRIEAMFGTWQSLSRAHSHATAELLSQRRINFGPRYEGFGLHWHNRAQQDE